MTEVGENKSFGVRPRLEILFYPILVSWSSLSYVASLIPSFLPCKIGMRRLILDMISIRRLAWYNTPQAPNEWFSLGVSFLRLGSCGERIP